MARGLGAPPLSSAAGRSSTSAGDAAGQPGPALLPPPLLTPPLSPASLPAGIVGNAIPPNYIPACEKGFREAVNAGQLIGHPVEVGGRGAAAAAAAAAISTAACSALAAAASPPGRPGPNCRRCPVHLCAPAAGRARGADRRRGACGGLV